MLKGRLSDEVSSHLPPCLVLSHALTSTGTYISSRHEDLKDECGLKRC